MQVKLRFPWFAPTAHLGTAGGRMSGHFYTAGVHEIDILWKGHLPTGSVILDEPVSCETEFVEEFEDHIKETVKPVKPSKSRK